MSQPYVFISYSRHDRPFVERLTAGLHKAGVQTWTDLDNISAGQEWAKEINRALFQTTALIYIASKHSGHSPWMESEFSVFLERAERVIPIIIDDEGPNNLPAPLRQFQWVDFRGRFEPALHSLIIGIGYLQGSSPIAAPQPKSKGYVFISYADEDAAFVADLKEFLKKQGYGYWDFRESERNYQVDYTLELENIIKDAKATLSVVSPDWKLSPTAFQELHFSREVQTPVFLLKVRDPGPTLAISGMTFIDFMRERQNGFAQLDSEMLRKGL